MNEIISVESTKKRLQDIEDEIKELEVTRAELKDKWLQEKNIIQNIQDIKAEIEEKKNTADSLERKGELAKVAELRYGVIPKLENELKTENNELEKLQTGGKMLKEVVDATDIAEVLSKWTGIPVRKMLETERQKLLQIEEMLSERVIGQSDAITAVANSIRRSRAGLQDVNRPIGSFIFLGSTGVGKTELAKALAEFLFDDENAIVRIDMSEYMDKFSVTRLIGAPPGYVGYEEGGQLTEAVRRRPYSVVLLDEIEKANSDIFNVLLQVLDDGRLTDGKGRTVNFKNTIIIMTSNLGSQIINEKIDFATTNNKEEIMQDIRIEMNELLKKSLRPEFLNRIDEIIIFNPLLPEDIIKITRLNLNSLTKKLQKENISISYSDELINYIAKEGFDLHFGARPLKRTILKNIIDPLSIEILSGRINHGDSIIINYTEDKGITFDKE